MGSGDHHVLQDVGRTAFPLPAERFQENKRDYLENSLEAGDVGNRKTCHKFNRRNCSISPVNRKE